jgi:hypothetical protein
LEEVSKRIETNEKTLETAENRIKSFEVNYKKEEEKAANPEPAGKVGEYECPICKEVCGNEQKHMVCISNCGHRFCKDCIDRVLGTVLLFDDNLNFRLQKTGSETGFWPNFRQKTRTWLKDRKQDLSQFIRIPRQNHVMLENLSQVLSLVFNPCSAFLSKICLSKNPVQ